MQQFQQKYLSICGALFCGPYLGQVVHEEDKGKSKLWHSQLKSVIARRLDADDVTGVQNSSPVRPTSNLLVSQSERPTFSSSAHPKGTIAVSCVSDSDCIGSFSGFRSIAPQKNRLAESRTPPQKTLALAKILFFDVFYPRKWHRKKSRRRKSARVSSKDDVPYGTLIKLRPLFRKLLADIFDCF